MTGPNDPLAPLPDIMGELPHSDGAWNRLRLALRERDALCALLREWPATHDPALFLVAAARDKLRALRTEAP